MDFNYLENLTNNEIESEYESIFLLSDSYGGTFNCYCGTGYFYYNNGYDYLVACGRTWYGNCGNNSTYMCIRIGSRVK